MKLVSWKKTTELKKKSLGNNFQFTNWPQVSVEMSVIYSSYFPSSNQHPKCIAIKPQSN